MSNREALRELQTRLAERLQQARGQSSAAGWLAVECGPHGLLFPLAGAGEIFASPTVHPVPHTQPWFVGVANLRGGLHGVVDIAVFLGLQDRTAWREGAQLVALNPATASQSALLVQRLAGLRRIDQMQRLESDEQARPAFAGDRWADPQGRVWQEINLAALARHPQYLAIAG
jgi:twitching motility protein PilI